MTRIIALRGSMEARARFIEVEEPDEGPVVYRLHATTADGYGMHEPETLTVTEVLALTAMYGVSA